MTNPQDPADTSRDEPTNATFTVAEPDTKPARGRYKGWLSKAFSIAATAGAGMGVGFAVKTCAISALCTVGAPAAVTAIMACAATGLVMGTGKALWRHHQKKKNGSTESFWSKKTGKRILFNTLVSSVAGTLAYTFADQIADVAGDLYDKGAELINGPATPPPSVVTVPPPEMVPPEIPAAPEVTPPHAEPPVVHAPQPEPLEPPAPPQEIAPPATPHDVAPPADTNSIQPPAEQIVPAPGALEKVAALAADGHLSGLAQQTLERAQAGNPQAIKDLGYFVFNGFQGFAENQELGVELFSKAAGLGNVQAQVDLAYACYHGLGGVQANPDTAYETMKGLAGHDSRARAFVKAWGTLRPAVMAATAPAP